MQQEGKQLVDAIVNAIQDKKGKNIVIADMKKIEDPVCQYFVICQGNTRPQVEAIAKNIGDQVRETTQEKPFAVSGENNAQWIAMDYGNVMVHVFLPETRNFYDLEHLWEDAEMTNIPDAEDEDTTF
jgi:ribosome-associated protein